jgi:hypothetical protein
MICVEINGMIFHEPDGGRLSYERVCELASGGAAGADLVVEYAFKRQPLFRQRLHAGQTLSVLPGLTIRARDPLSAYRVHEQESPQEPKVDDLSSVIDELGVWHELELALWGRNGFGGDVAEIYAYRLIPGGATAVADPANALFAGRRMTALLRRFVDLHPGVAISIEEREGFRVFDVACEEFPAFDWRVHLRVDQAKVLAVTPSTKELREALGLVAKHSSTLVAMLDELVSHRAKARLGAEPQDPAPSDDLPSDAPTGLYLDRPFDGTDLEWLKQAWLAYISRHDDGFARPKQLMLVFQTIYREPRARNEFLRVMNTIVLPLCRRLRLQEQPQLRDLGASE